MEQKKAVSCQDQGQAEQYCTSFDIAYKSETIFLFLSQYHRFASVFTTARSAMQMGRGQHAAIKGGGEEE